MIKVIKKLSVHGSRFIAAIIFLIAFFLLTTNYQPLTIYADEDNSSGGNNTDSESVTGGDVGAESISGSATDEQGNTTTFDSQGNITGESGPDGGPGSTTSGGDVGAVTDTSGTGGYTASGNAVVSATQQALDAQNNLAGLIAAQEPFANNAALADQIAAAQTAFNNAMDQLTGAMQSNFTNNGISWSYSGNGVIGAPGTGPSAAGPTTIGGNAVANAAAPAPAAAPAAAPVPAAAPAGPSGTPGFGVQARTDTENPGRDGIGRPDAGNNQAGQSFSMGTIGPDGKFTAATGNIEVDVTQAPAGLPSSVTFTINNWATGAAVQVNDLTPDQVLTNGNIDGNKVKDIADKNKPQ